MRRDDERPFRLPPDATGVELLAKYFRAFGEPTRLRILGLVAEREHSVGELVEALDQRQSHVSHHLTALRWCGLVNPEPRGRKVFYRVSDPRVTEVIALTRALLGEIGPGPVRPPAN